MCKSAAYFWVLGLTDADLKFNLNFNTCSTVVSHPCFLSLMCTCPCPWEGYSLKIDCFSDSDWWWGEIIGKTPIIFYLTHTKGDFFKVQIPWFFLKGTKIAGIYNCMHDQVTGNRPKKIWLLELWWYYNCATFTVSCMNHCALVRALSLWELEMMVVPNPHR